MAEQANNGQATGAAVGAGAAAAGAATATEPRMPVWIETLPKGVRENKELLATYADKSFEDFLTDHINLSKTVKERGLIIPGKDASLAEIKAFNDKMGLPMKPEDYALTFDEKLMSKEHVEELRAHYFKNGFTKNQAQADLTSRMEVVKRGMESAAGREKEARDNFVANLIKENGGDQKAAEEDLNLAQKYIQNHYSQDTRARLVREGTMYDPKFLKDAAKSQRELEPKPRVDGDIGVERGGAKEKPRGRYAGLDRGSQFDEVYGQQARGGR